VSLEREVERKQVMADEEVSSGSTETDQPAKGSEYYDATHQVAGEYYETDRETAGEYIAATRARAVELYDSATAKAGEVLAMSREHVGSISEAVEAWTRAHDEELRIERSRLLDVSGRPIERQRELHGDALADATPEGFVNLIISRQEFDRLSGKTREILTQAALAHERIAKDHEEIDLLKTETRETLRRLRAA